MLNIKNLLIVVFICISLKAEMLNDIVFVENKDSDEISLKNEFLNDETELYTISIGTLTLERHDPIDFFKTYKMTNALAYKFGENKEFARVVSGVYNTGTEASLDIKNLDPRLQKNKPYAAKLKRHQSLFKEDLSNSGKSINKVPVKIKQNNKLAEAKNSIYTTNEKGSVKLKKEFLNSNSKYYSIALGSISLNKNSIQHFFDAYGVGDKALAHVYGEDKDKARIIYGLYKTAEEANKALETLNERLKANSPFASKIKRYQKFYKKYYPAEEKDKMIVELKLNEKKEDKFVPSPKLTNEVKNENKSVLTVTKEIEKPKKEKPKKVIPKKKKPKKVVKKPKAKKVIKKSKSKKIKKEDLNKNRFVKYSKLEDVYYIESKGSFNILSEVFLNNGSSFYTVDLGELKLNETSIEEFFIKNGMENDALAYKYGNKKEFARVVYGAYETKNEAANAIKSINVNTPPEKLRVSNIKNHQKLYKEFHKSGYKPKSKKAFIESDIVETDFGQQNDSSIDDIVFVNNLNEKNSLKEEFFNRDSSLYTITLITFLTNDMSPEEFFSKNNLTSNVIAYPIGKVNNYYRVIFGLYNSSNEAREAMKELNPELRKNVPYVSRIRTNQKKFESYNRNLEEEKNRLRKIEF